MKPFPAFHDRYPSPLIKWVAGKKWPAFRGIQEQAIAHIPITPSEPLNDFILAAETSSGKTEAVFLPLLARVLQRPATKTKGFSILYISPLRALINDQFQRLERLGALIDLPVFRWHVDVPAKDKTRARNTGRGVLMTTPESLEGFLQRDGREGIPLEYFDTLDATVIDELHAFFENARGRQLQSLLHRVETRAGRVIPRLALSATLGDIGDAAARVLRPKAKTSPTILATEAEQRAARISLKVFLDESKPATAGTRGNTVGSQAVHDEVARTVLGDFADVERGLIFCNSRARVETLYEKLVGFRKDGDPAFGQHHSNIDGKVRMKLEADMRGDTPNAPKKLVIVCTNSLELGIDIGQTEIVAQIESTHSVAALRQRIGRSGRRGGAPIGIIYAVEKAVGASAHPLDALRLRTFQAAATMTLALEGRFESPSDTDLHLSTLVHQVLSLAKQRNGFGAAEAWQLLVQAGPWDAKIITEPFFERLLQTLAEGKWPLLTKNNEKWTLLQDGHSPPTAIFATPPEYAVVFGARTIGQLPMTVSYRAGDTFVLAGARWKVRSVSDEAHRINVTIASSAGAPRFGGTVQLPSGLVVARMRELYQSARKIDGLANNSAERCIREGRAAFKRLRLDQNQLLQINRDTIVFPWTGSRQTLTLMLALRREGLRVSSSSFALTVEDASPSDVRSGLKEAVRRGIGDLDELAREARQLASDRYDSSLIPYHQRLAFSRRYLSGQGFGDLVARLRASGDAASMPTTEKDVPK